MAKDPVCGMEVNERSALYKSSFQGETYYFCSPECKREFDMNPSRYSEQRVYSAEMKERAGRAGEKAEQMAGKARSRAKSMAAERKGRIAEQIGGVAQALRRTAQQLQGQQGTVARYADKAAERFDRFSNYLREKDVDAILDDTKRFARRQPGIYLGGAFALGFVMARFLKSSTRSRPTSSVPGPR